MTLKDRLYGLVLAGGMSSRMGSDKGLIDYHGMPQREYVYKILQSVCERVFFSVRADQAEQISSNFDLIIDKDKYKGPFNGILSAHEYDKEAAWLILACDLPFMNLTSLRYLVDRRRPEKMSTAYVSAEDGLPEPLVAIWEPAGLKRVKRSLESGMGYSPRKFLMRNDVELVSSAEEGVLLNVNSVDDYEKVLTRLGWKSTGVENVKRNPAGGHGIP